MGKAVGFIGVGTMGRGMARSLLRNGYQLKVFNRTRSKAEDLARIGGVVTESPAEAASAVDAVVLMLADRAAVLSVVDGPEGILTTIAPGTVVIDCSTVEPSTSLYVNERLEHLGAAMLDAPVFGSKNEAENANLGFIVGGRRDTFDRTQELLTAMGRPFYIGANGMGAYAKLVVNVIIAGTLQLWNEGMALATKAGIEPEVIHEVIMSSRARSEILDMKAPQVMKRDFTPFFALRLMNKDLNLAMQTAEQIGVPMPLASQLRKVFGDCIEAGLGEEDFCASVKLVEQLAQVTIHGKA